MKQTFTKESIVLHEGEVLIIDNGVELFSTANYRKLGVLHLDRKAFVKPVDVEALGLSKFNYKREGISDSDRDMLATFATIWEEGYKANPNEFTREQLITAMQHAREYLGTNEQIIEMITPLSIPTSVTIENNQVIEVKWND